MKKYRLHLKTSKTGTCVFNKDRSRCAEHLLPLRMCSESLCNVCFYLLSKPTVLMIIQSPGMDKISHSSWMI